MNIDQFFIILFIIGTILAIFLVGPSFYWWTKLPRDSSINFSRLIFMNFRKIDMKQVITAYIDALKNDLNPNMDNFEAQFLAGGNIIRVVQALILAKNNKIDLVFNRAAAIDLAGSDVLAAVEEATKAKEVEYPENKKCIEFEMKKNGENIKLKFLIKLKLNLERFIGGIEQENLLSKIEMLTNEYIAKSDKMPDLYDIRNEILQGGIDAGSKYELVDIVLTEC